MTTVSIFSDVEPGGGRGVDAVEHGVEAVEARHVAEALAVERIEARP